MIKSFLKNAAMLMPGIQRIVSQRDALLSEKNSLQNEVDIYKRCLESLYPGDDIYYFDQPDARYAVENGHFVDGMAHFVACGLMKTFERRTTHVYSILFPYVQGNGLEIGPLDHPFPAPSGAHVTYIDRIGKNDLCRQYPEIDADKIIEPDIIDDAETLSSIEDESQDFIIAIHVIEHMQNPIGAINNFLRVLKIGGNIVLRIPNGRFTKDQLRPVTTLEHLVQDYESGPELSERMHYREYSEYVHKQYLRLISTDEEVEADIKKLCETAYSIHFHVWTPLLFQELFAYCKKQLQLPMTMALFINNQSSDEFAVVLRKQKV